jgi:hypothetical protein
MIAFVALAGISSGGASAASTPVTITPPSHGFGSTFEGQSSSAQTFTVHNTGATSITLRSLLPLGGADPGEFSLANDDCSGATVSAGGSCTFDASFTPVFGPGHRDLQSATVSVADNAGDDPVALSLSGTALAPQISISPSPLDLGDVPVGSSTSAPVTVSNTGQGTLTIGSVTPMGAGFSVVTNGCAGAQLTNGQSCDITVGFDSTAPGAANGSLTVVSNDPDQQTPTPVGLTADGTQPGVGFSGNAAFNADLDSTSSPQAITVSNTGNAPLQITTVALGGTDPGSFSIQSDDCAGATVPAGESCDVGITFTASDANPKSAVLLVTDNAPDSPQGNALTGTANVPGVSITPESVHFNSVQAGRVSAAARVTIKNSGTAVLKIGAITIAGTQAKNFLKGAAGTGDTCSHKTIAVGGTCFVNVTFTPSSAGGRVADLLIPNNGPNAAVPLSGTGLWPPSPTSLNLALGCNSAKLNWRLPAGMHLFLYTQVVRNASHMPTSPTDGTVLPRTSGSVMDQPLAHYHSFYYAVYSVFGSTNGEAKHFSRPTKASGHTGTICAPRNHGITVDLTPLASWLPYGAGAKYSVLLQRSGHTILVRFPSGASYQFPSKWTYGGGTHAFARGGVYFLYVYAYTTARPKGFLIGQSQFSEAP